MIMNYCCQQLSAPCTGTFYRRCCGNLRCEFDIIGAGTCQKCVRSNYACVKNKCEGKSRLRIKCITATQVYLAGLSSYTDKRYVTESEWSALKNRLGY
ncbi:hypothetical protein KSF78_0008277 [Schistosoma japonicum]|nr:hypothetical protein KSF78_0008277 [Schistosoma japonicum]